MSLIERKVSLIDLVLCNLNAKSLLKALANEINIPSSIIESIIKVPYYIMFAIKLKHNAVLVFNHFITCIFICSLLLLNINFEQIEQFKANAL